MLACSWRERTAEKKIARKRGLNRQAPGGYPIFRKGCYRKPGHPEKSVSYRAYNIFPPKGCAARGRCHAAFTFGMGCLNGPVGMWAVLYLESLYEFSRYPTLNGCEKAPAHCDGDSFVPPASSSYWADVGALRA